MPLAGEKVERNDVMMSWERAARSNCNAERDGCCSVRRNCRDAPDGGAAQRLSFSLPIWQAKTWQHTTPFVLHFFSLDIIMSGL